MKKVDAAQQESNERPGFTARIAQIISGLSTRVLAIIAAGGIMLILIPYLFFWAQPGYQYFVVYPTGSKSAIMTEGIKWRGFAQIIPWQKVYRC